MSFHLLFFLFWFGLLAPGSGSPSPKTYLIETIDQVISSTPDPNLYLIETKDQVSSKVLLVLNLLDRNYRPGEF